MVGELLVKEFAKHIAFVEWLVLELKCGDETSGVEIEERLRFLVGIDFDVLIGDVLLF